MPPEQNLIDFTAQPKKTKKNPPKEFISEIIYCELYFLLQ